MSSVFWTSFPVSTPIRAVVWGLVVFLKRSGWVFDFLVGWFCYLKVEVRELDQIQCLLVNTRKIVSWWTTFPKWRSTYRHIPPSLQATKAGAQANIPTYSIIAKLRFHNTILHTKQTTFLIQTKHWQQKTPTPHPQTDLHGLRLRGGNFSSAFLFQGSPRWIFLDTKSSLWVNAIWILAIFCC